MSPQDHTAAQLTELVELLKQSSSVELALQYCSLYRVTISFGPELDEWGTPLLKVTQDGRWAQAAYWRAPLTYMSDSWSKTLIKAITALWTTPL